MGKRSRPGDVFSFLEVPSESSIAALRRNDGTTRNDSASSLLQEFTAHSFDITKMLLRLWTLPILLFLVSWTQVWKCGSAYLL